MVIFHHLAQLPSQFCHFLHLPKQNRADSRNNNDQCQPNPTQVREKTDLPVHIPHLSYLAVGVIRNQDSSETYGPLLPLTLSLRRRHNIAWNFAEFDRCALEVSRTARRPPTRKLVLPSLLFAGGGVGVRTSYLRLAPTSSWLLPPLWASDQFEPLKRGLHATPPLSDSNAKVGAFSF